MIKIRIFLRMILLFHQIPAANDRYCQLGGDTCK